MNQTSNTKERSSTPRTDALLEQRRLDWEGRPTRPSMSDLARQLEHELANSDARHRADSLAWAAQVAELKFRLSCAQTDYETLRAALADLVTRCDGAEGVRADGSNICTMAAHAALGDFQKETDHD